MAKPRVSATAIEGPVAPSIIPTGAEIIDVGGLWFPVVIVENVHIFPGIPELFEKEGEIAKMQSRTGSRSEEPALQDGGQTEKDQKTHGVGDHRQEDR